MQPRLKSIKFQQQTIVSITFGTGPIKHVTFTVISLVTFARTAIP